MNKVEKAPWTKSRSQQSLPVWPERNNRRGCYEGPSTVTKESVPDMRVTLVTNTVALIVENAATGR